MPNKVKYWLDGAEVELTHEKRLGNWVFRFEFPNGDYQTYFVSTQLANTLKRAIKYLQTQPWFKVTK